MKWQELTSSALNQVDRITPVFIPVAAIEQHGPHLPLGTDSMIADHFMDTLHDGARKDILILPTIRVGCSDHHMKFAGSLTAAHNEFGGYVEAVAQSVIHHGFTKIILFNCHGGNQAIGQVVLERMGYQFPECDFFLVTWWSLALKQLIPIQESSRGGVGHAGEFETSLMLLINPNLVDVEKIPQTRGNLPNYTWATGDLISKGSVSYYRRMDENSPNGAVGDPFLGTKKKGELITQVVLDRLNIMIDDIYEAA